MNKKIVIISVAIIVVLTTIGFLYYRGQSFSKGILKLEILGPEIIQMGEEITYTVRYKNNSDFTLEEPRLAFEYPEYGVSEDGKSIANQTLNDIYPGDEQFVQFKARMLGKENDLKTAKASLSYKPKNLKARYESNTTLTSKIGSVPITLDFDLPSKIESNKDVQFSINYFSNIDYALSGLKLQVQYPDKFEFTSAIPKPLDKTEWQLPDLNKAQGGRVTISGKSSEGVGKTITFSAELGVWRDGNFISLKQASKDVEIVEPMLYISQQINNSADYVATPGETLHYQIYFKNISNTSFENLYLINTLNSPIFDLSTIKVASGGASVQDNMIVWDWKQVSDLRILDAQEEGMVAFDVTLKTSWSQSETNSTAIKNKVTLSQISKEFQNKVNSAVVISQTGSHDSNIFANSGSIPPAVGQATTYTITWQVRNYFNNVKNVKVRATLPAGVALTGSISPAGATSNFAFDSNSRGIVWSVAQDMPAGSDTASISFQLSLTPVSNQTGRAIFLIGVAIVSAEDQLTGQVTTGTAPAVDTTLQSSNPIEEWLE